MRQTLEKSKPVGDLLQKWLGVGAMICAGVLTPMEYLDVKQEKRVERTLAYVERFGDGIYADSAQLLDEAIEDHFADLSKLLSSNSLSPAELEKEYAALILSMFKNPALRSAINQVLRFHEELVQCVVNELCDSQVTLDFFLNSTGDILRTYYPYICDKRSKWNDPTAYQHIEDFYLQQPDTDICVSTAIKGPK